MMRAAVTSTPRHRRAPSTRTSVERLDDHPVAGGSRRRTCTNSPSARAPIRTCALRAPVLHHEHDLAPVALDHRRSGTAGTRLRSCAPSSRSRKATFALMSGSTRGSRSRSRIFTSTVALARSTVGTMRCTTPAKRCSGSASSWISQGCPTLTLPSEDSETSASTSSVLHVGHRHHRALGAGADGERRDVVADVGVLGEHHAVEGRADQRLLDRHLGRPCRFACAAPIAAFGRAHAGSRLVGARDGRVVRRPR